MTPEQQRQLSSAEARLIKARKRLGYPGPKNKTSGEEKEYALAHAAVTRLLQIDSPGILGVRRTRYKFGI